MALAANVIVTSESTSSEVNELHVIIVMLNGLTDTQLVTL